MRQDSIRKKGLEAHVNAYCEAKGIPYRYKHLAAWIDRGEYGEKLSNEWIRRRFAPISRVSFEKWLLIYNEEKQKGMGK